jgi:hypothetical protein
MSRSRYMYICILKLNFLNTLHFLKPLYTGYLKLKRQVMGTGQEKMVYTYVECTRQTTINMDQTFLQCQSSTKSWFMVAGGRPRPPRAEHFGPPQMSQPMQFAMVKKIDLCDNLSILESNWMTHLEDKMFRSNEISLLDRLSHYSEFVTETKFRRLFIHLKICLDDTSRWRNVTGSECLWVILPLGRNVRVKMPLVLDLLADLKGPSHQIRFA